MKLKYMLMLVIVALCGTTASARSGNRDPRYNITCEPGQMVIQLSSKVSGQPGVTFLCRADSITRSFRYHQLKEDAVIDEVGGLGLAGQAAAHLDGSVPSIVMAASGRRVAELEYDLLMLIRAGYTA